MEVGDSETIPISSSKLKLRLPFVLARHPRQDIAEIEGTGRGAQGRGDHISIPITTKVEWESKASRSPRTERVLAGTQQLRRHVVTRGDREGQMSRMGGMRSAMNQRKKVTAIACLRVQRRRGGDERSRNFLRESCRWPSRLGGASGSRQALPRRRWRRTILATR